ncbi:MAG TPA: AAA family ATPase [Desulfomonilaceae bacterium]|nr:AAA family ATPase [Desulfomonilaceae bacterium]
MYLKSVEINSDGFPTHDLYPFNIRALNSTDRIEFSSPITFFVGRNGSGKSALLDAIARKSGLLPWGGIKAHRVHENPYETQLANFLALTENPRHSYGFHFRAEAFFNFAASLDDIILDDPDRDHYFGGKSLNVVSHGESFLTFFKSYTFQLDGLYLLDEPEAALSPHSQLEFVQILLDAVRAGRKQYIIATHSPIIMGCPGAKILTFDAAAIEQIDYRLTEHYSLYREFMSDPEKFFHPQVLHDNGFHG